MSFLCLQVDIVTMILMAVEEAMMTTTVVTEKRLPKLMKDMEEVREALAHCRIYGIEIGD